MILASADKGRHGFSRGKTTPGVVILVGGRQPTCLVCLPSRRLSSVKNSEGLAGRSGATYARQRTQAYWRKSRTITQQMAAQADPQACMPLSADAAIQETDEGGLTDMNDNTIKFVVPDEADQEMKALLTTVYSALSEKGYNPINQIVGYLLSEDPTYITNYNNARSLIRKVDRDELLQELVRHYLFD